MKTIHLHAIELKNKENYRLEYPSKTSICGNNRLLNGSDATATELVE